VNSVAEREGSALSDASGIKVAVQQSCKDERLANHVERDDCTAIVTPKRFFVRKYFAFYVIELTYIDHSIEYSPATCA